MNFDDIARDLLDGADALAELTWFDLARILDDSVHAPTEEPTRTLILNAMTEICRDADRAELIALYRLTEADGVLTLPDSDAALQLWTDAMRAATTAMNRYLDTQFFSDDDQDYMNAISDQISYLTEARTHDTHEELIADLHRALNEPSDGTDYPRCAFQLGYADHASPLSTLARMNKD